MHGLGQSLAGELCSGTAWGAAGGGAPCHGTAGAWSGQPVQAGKAEVGLVSPSEPQEWDLHSPCPRLRWCQPDMAEGVLVLSGVELIFFPVPGTVLGFGMRIMVMK